MKTSVLIPAIIFILSVSFSRLNAQCSVYPPTITINSTSVNGSGNCVVNLDVTFDLPNSNGGNAYQNIHIWTSAAYASLPANLYGNQYNNAPTVAALDAAQTLATITINKDLSTSQCYARNGSSCSGTQPASLQLNKTIVKVINGSTLTYTVKNIIITLPGACNIASSLKADIWSSQANSNNSVACVSRDFGFSINDINLSGFKDCNSPRMIHFGIFSNSTSLPAKFTYRIYRDNGNGTYEPGDQDVTLAPSITDTISIDASGFSGQISKVVGFTGNNAQGEKSDYWVVITQVGQSSNTSILLKNAGCIPLPVKLSSFNGNLNNKKVSLQWVVAENEIADMFEVEKSIDGTNFTTAAVVFGSDKTGIENYQFAETMNVEKIFYRLRMTDKSQVVTYSKILMFQTSVISSNNSIKIMNNPATDRLTFSFELNSYQKVEAKIIDLSGRTQMKQTVNGSQGNNYVSMQMAPAMQNGIYLLEVIAGTERYIAKFVKQ